MASPAEVVECDPAITEKEFQSPSHSKEPAIGNRLGVFGSLLMVARLWTFKTIVTLALRALRWQRREFAPTLTKYYSTRPNLGCRVFIPPNITFESSTKLPTYINIHGGGFALCDASVDDSFSHTMSKTHSLLVISINYRKGPTHRFPTAVNDTVALINAILTDPLLPIDPSRVALGGFSAGGNLTLTSALHPSLHNKLSALVSIYPVVDFSGRFKGIFRKSPHGKPDMLESTGSWFSWAYIPENTDRKHPVLSPIYAPLSAFATPKMFFVGAEYDYLCAEAHAMAKRLAGKPVENVQDVSKFEDQWESNEIKWRMFRGQQHGFTHVKRSGEEEKGRKQATDDLYAAIGRWLKEDVWAKGKAGGQENGRQANGKLVDI